MPRRRLPPPERKINMMKTPLEKSLSMPDMENRLKKRERLIAYVFAHEYSYSVPFFVPQSTKSLFMWNFASRLKEYNRSESERSFDETQMKKARMKSLGQAYLSPQNRSLAQSFRYMRNKPTIIAFKTPSLENCEQRPSQNSLGSMSKTSLFRLPINSPVIINFHIHSCIAWSLFAKRSRRRWHLPAKNEPIQQWFAFIFF